MAQIIDPVGQIRWLGHSTVAIDLDGVRLLTDPVLGRRVAHLRRQHDPLDAASLLPLDLVLISHAHWDHLDTRTLVRLGRAQPLVVPAGAGVLLHRHGFVAVREVSLGEEIAIGAATISVVQADHDAARGPLGIDSPAFGYVVRGSRSVYFAGDTDVFAGMSDLAPVDVALLPVSGWGGRVPAGHLDPERAAEAVSLLRPSIVVPIHWGTYGPLYRRRGSGSPAEDFSELVRERCPEVEVRTLAIGDSFRL